MCPGYVRTPLVEGQIADQARTHGIDEDEVLDDVLLARTPVKRLVEPDGGRRPGRLPVRPRHRLDHRKLIPHGRRLDRRVKGTQTHMSTQHPTARTAAPPGPAARRQRRIVKVVFASLIGTAIEWYDFFLYGSAAALVFGELFFARSDPVTGHAARVRHLRARLRRPPARRRGLRPLR